MQIFLKSVGMLFSDSLIKLPIMSAGIWLQNGSFYKRRYFYDWQRDTQPDDQVPPPPQTHFELVMKISSKNKTPVMSKVCAQSISSGTLVINIAQVSSSASFTSMKLHSFERSYSQYIHKFTSTSNHLLCTILDARLHTFKTQVKYRA